MLRHYLPLAIIPLALIFWGLFGASPLMTASYSALVDYQTPYKQRSAPGSPGDALSDQVVIVVVGGLRLDQSLGLNTLQQLRARGADRVVRTGLPSFSLPGWAVIGTGAWQEQHGQTTNLDARPLAIDSLFEAAHRKGLSTALAGAAGWDVLFKDQIDMLRTEPNPPARRALDDARKQDDAIEANALQLLTGTRPGLLLVQFAELNDAYHAFGVFSQEGRQALQDVDTRLGRLVQAVDLSRSTLIITADHGQIDPGGSGGPEDAVVEIPLVAVGKGVQPGKYTQAMQTDIAPTAAILLGTSIPAESQGDVLFDMLDMPGHAQAVRSVDWVRQIVDRYDVIDKVIGVGSLQHPKLAEAQSDLLLGDDAGTLAAVRAEVAATRDAAVSFREGRLEQERLMRIPAFLLLLLPLALYAWFARRMDWEFKRPVIAGLVYFVVFYALFVAHGYGFSLSAVNEDSLITSWFAARAVDSILALCGAAVVLGLLSHGEYKTWTTLNVFNMAFVVAALLWFQVCIFYWLYDFSWSWYLPDPVLSFKYFIDVIQTGSFMPGNPPLPVILALPLLTLVVKWAAERTGDFLTQRTR